MGGQNRAGWGKGVPEGGAVLGVEIECGLCDPGTDPSSSIVVAGTYPGVRGQTCPCPMKAPAYS